MDLSPAFVHELLKDMVANTSVSRRVYDIIWSGIFTYCCNGHIQCRAHNVVIGIQFATLVGFAI